MHTHIHIHVKYPGDAPEAAPVGVGHLLGAQLHVLQPRGRPACVSLHHHRFLASVSCICGLIQPDPSSPSGVDCGVGLCTCLYVRMGPRAMGQTKRGDTTQAAARLQNPKSITPLLFCSCASIATQPTPNKSPKNAPLVPRKSMTSTWLLSTMGRGAGMPAAASLCTYV